MHTLRNLGSWSKAQKMLLALPVLAPVVFIIYLIAHYGVNIAYSDEWNMVPIFQHIGQGNLTFNDLWQESHSIHRLFFPEILVGTVAYFTHWNIKVEMFMSFGFCLITATLLYLLIKGSVKNSALAFLSMLVGVFWLFSPVQSESWLWGWDIAWFMSITLAVAAIYWISRMKGRYAPRYLAGAIAAAGIAMYTFSLGQAIWPVGLIMLLAQKQKKKPIIIWSVAGLLAYGVYYYHFNTSAGAPPPFAFLHHPINVLSYFLVMFGRPFTDKIGAAMMLGMVALLLLIPVLSLAWEQRSKLNAFLPWLGLILFSLIGACMIVLARLSGDLTQAAQSRYTAISILYIIGLSGLIFSLLDNLDLTKKLIKYVVLVVVAIELPLLCSSYAIGISTSQSARTMMEGVKLCSDAPTPSDICLRYDNYFSTPRVAREQLQYLKQKHWAGY